MAINYAEKYSPQVDERFKLGSLTTALVNHAYDWLGVATVKVYSVPTAEMNDYTLTGSNRYGTPAELNNEVQEMTLAKDRSFTFTIDKKSEDDTMGVMAAGAALARQIDEVIIPEIDTYRISKLVAGAPITQSDTTFGANLLLRVLEKVAPTLAFTYPTAGAYITNATPVIKFKVTDNDSGVNPDTIVIKVDGAKVTTAFTKTAVTGGYECSYTPGTALADGAHTVSIEASDYDGNAASAKTVSFTVDTIPPTLTLTNPVDGLITNKAALVVSGKTDDVTSKPVIVTVNGASVTVNSDGSFSKEITLVSGSNTITVVATDKAGKTTTVTRKVTLDTGAPVFEKVTLTPNPVDCGKTFVISVKVTD